ncbi:MAG: hypothetical protein WCH98_02475 [Verrucomicrobiota bacterium]
MKTYMLNQGLYTEDSIDTDPVAGRMIMERAIELATNDGRSAIDLSSNDWQQARRELTGKTE